MEKKIEDRIDAYLLGNMTEEERRQFEADVKKDELLKEQFEFSKNVYTALKSRTEKLIAIKKWEKRDKAQQENYKKAIRRSLYWTSGIAAVFVIGVIIINIYKLSSFDNQNIISKRYSTPNETESINNPQTQKGSLTKQDYKELLAKIEEEETEIRSEIMLLERELDSRGRGDNNEKKQKELQHNLEHLILEKVQVLIALNRSEDALMLLDEILNNPNTEFKEQADSLRKILK